MSFDTSTHFDENLRDVPNNPDEMRQALATLKGQVEHLSDPVEKIRVLGQIGSYARLLHDFETAKTALREAIGLSQNHLRAKLTNQIRLAHVYQWEGNFAVSNGLFSVILDTCQRHLPELLDFAYQHAGKNQFDQQHYVQAAELFERALQIRLEKGESELIDSSWIALETARRKSIESV